MTDSDQAHSQEEHSRWKHDVPCANVTRTSLKKAALVYVTRCVMISRPSWSRHRSRGDDSRSFHDLPSVDDDLVGRHTWATLLVAVVINLEKATSVHQKGDCERVQIVWKSISHSSERFKLQYLRLYVYYEVSFPTFARFFFLLKNRAYLIIEWISCYTFHFLFGACLTTLAHCFSYFSRLSQSNVRVLFKRQDNSSTEE